MDNVYDLVADFYDNDEGWNTVLRREYAEGFLRKEAWSGLVDEQLQDEWEQVLILCLYLGNADILIGDMSPDDIIDAVAWCGRNVADFQLSYQSVQEFLNVLSRLFVYLKDKKAITTAVAPQLAKEELLLDDDTLGIIDDEGEFLPGEDERREFATPDVPSKIFLNMGDSLGDLLEELHSFFQKDNFNLDLERAVFFYHGFFAQGDLDAEAEDEEFWQCFWDYFLFDYHLIENDLTPLQYFARQGATANLALVQEISRAHLAVFSVEEARDEGYYFCRDFLTQEEYLLNLPLEDDMEWEDMLIIGHIFYNQSMVMNYVRCLKINKLARKQLHSMLESSFQWFKIQEPEGTMADFIARHPMVIRRLTYFYAHYIKLSTFKYETQVSNYQPALAVDDDVLNYIEKFMEPQHFSRRDISLATRLWTDFAQSDRVKVRKPEIWASGVVANYIHLNGVYSYSDQNVAEMCWSVPLASLKLATKRIKETLKLEKHDPRYCNEEGFLMMVFSK